MAQILESVIGHEQVIATLQQSVLSERFPSTSIYSGPSGVGKKLVALGFVQTLACEMRTVVSAKACGLCGPCLRIETRQSEALHVVEPAGTQIKIEQAHEVTKARSGTCSDN